MRISILDQPLAALSAGLLFLAGVLAGCGGSSSSATGPSATSGSLSSLEVEVVPDATTLAPQRPMLARGADLLGWPQIAEASHESCSVTAGINNVSASLGPDHKVKLLGVQVDATGHFPLTIACSDGTGGTLTLTAMPGHVVVLKVSAKRGEIRVKFKDEHA